jgi:hypothetical protein
LPKTTISLVTSICLFARMEQLDSHWMVFFLWNFIFDDFLKIYLKNSNFFRMRITGILHEVVRKFMIKSRWCFLRMRRISDKICTKNQNTRLYSTCFFFVSKIMPSLKKYGKCDTARETIHDNIVLETKYAILHAC